METDRHVTDVTEYAEFRSAVFSQLKVKHRWTGVESDLPNMNIDAVEVLARFAWLTNQCPFCSGSTIAEMAGLEGPKGECH